MVESAVGATSLDFCPLPTLGGAELIGEVVWDAIANPTNSVYCDGDHKSLLRLRQVEALLKKNPSIDGASQDDRKAKAFAKFRKVQRRNARSAKRLRLYFGDPQRIPPLVRLVLDEARMDLFRLLGPYPTADDWEEFMRAAPFSSGTLQGLQRFGKQSAKDCDPYAKVGPEQVLTSTAKCMRFYGSALLAGSYGNHLQDLYRKGKLGIEEAVASVLSTQPKDASIDRVITTEPLLNAMAQRGCAAMLNLYLRDWGINLHDQSRNGKLARTASERGFAPDGFSTVDLVSASDTVLTVLVRRQLPEGWFDALDACRTGSWSLDDEVSQDDNTFSFMGNGFTFPLQCLLFASLVRACIRLTACDDRRWRVYGDDIVCPTGASAILLEVLRFCGFIPNIAKSHVVGFFRESCGQDWLNGNNVRPVFLKDSLGKRTTRHAFFNRLQMVDRSHPVLGTMLASEKDPLVGPAIGPAGGEEGHYVAPIFVLNKVGKVEWLPAVQSYAYWYKTLVGAARRRTRNDDGRRLLACLAGSPGPRHDIRDTIRYRVELRCTTTPFVAAPASPAWYIF
jgi:hypothetical protein